MLRKSWLVLLALAVIVAVSALPQGAAQASTYNGTVVFTCAGANAAGTGSHVLNRDNTGSGQESLRVDIRDGAGTLIFTLSFQNTLGSFAGGMGNFTYTTPPQYNPIVFTLTSLAGNGFAEQVDVQTEGTCAGLPTFAAPVPQFAGPGVPAGFVLRTIACTTAVFNGPNGTAIAGATVRQGQTWYVNPTPTDPDVNGRRWTEIFVSGFQNGFIPAECVGGQEPLAVFVRPSPSNSSVGSMTGVVQATTGGTAAAAAVLTGGADGQTLTNAAGQTVYVVAAGDRLFRIALKFGVSVTALATTNGITNFSLIYPGQQLIIPR
jgi:LysM repeat protein